MVGWSGQEHGEYEVVGHLPVYRMTCFRKLSDEIWLSSSENSLCFFHTYWSIPLGNRNFLLTPSTFLTGDLFENFPSVMLEEIESSHTLGGVGEGHEREVGKVCMLLFCKN